MNLRPPATSDDRRTYRILVIDLEPTPYKTDLWNAFSDSKNYDIFVVYTEKKNWSPDGGHNYLKWPESRHGNAILEGLGVSGVLRSALFVANKICGYRADLIYIAGYVHFPAVIALVCSIFLGKRFVMHADEFNNSRPQGQLNLIKWCLRETLRKLVFTRGDAVLVCGRRGRETALDAGCNAEKILEFPYVVDVERLKADVPEVVATQCVADLAEGTTVLFFSGRMIPRKGLSTLLAALSGTPLGKDWVLWIEGEGPELSRYMELAQELCILDRCRFLSFCQYDVHSWLIRSADIVIVPSLVDTWGIVVDEGIQLGKAVISSDATGSGYDRIQNGHNGFLFPAGDVESLSDILVTLLDDKNLRLRIGGAAMSGAKNLKPSDNQETIFALIANKL